MEKTLKVDMSKDVVTCAVPYGGALFINNMIPHRRYKNFIMELSTNSNTEKQNTISSTTNILMHIFYISV